MNFLEKKREKNNWKKIELIYWKKLWTKIIESSRLTTVGLKWEKILRNKLEKNNLKKLKIIFLENTMWKNINWKEIDLIYRKDYQLKSCD